MLPAQLAADLEQAGLVEFALPVGFQRLLQFTVAADAGKTEGVGERHAEISMQIDGGIVDSARRMRQTQ
ncbi:hypothetical protein G039_0316060 [Pseudomonas aeruginosa VRFPA01]|nr:hypothetical protein G039_0316060 [Pseudomonas aeruginosa VRFPA01]